MDDCYYYKAFCVEINEDEKNCAYTVTLDWELKFSKSFERKKLCRAISLGIDVEKFKGEIIKREIDKYLNQLAKNIKNSSDITNDMYVKVLIYSHIIENTESLLSFRYMGLDISIITYPTMFEIWINDKKEYGNTYNKDFVNGLWEREDIIIEQITQSLGSVLAHFDKPFRWKLMASSLDTLFGGGN